MTYVEAINATLRELLDCSSRTICFGQNISAGSCLSGLTRNLPVRNGVQVLDTPNCENALVAFGFGLMFEGVNSIFFVKQLDFLLLACDQLANTHNMARLRSDVGSFSIVPIVVDSGFEGPQSRLNTLPDLCSMTDLPGFALAETGAARQILRKQLTAPGARVLAVSQRLLRSESGEQRADPVDEGTGLFRLEEGGQATIVAFNFAWPQARALHAELATSGIRASLFGVAACDPPDWTAVSESVKRTGRLILLDDSRSRNRPGDRLRATLADRLIPHAALQLYRPIDVCDLKPHADRFEVDTTRVLEWFQKSHAREEGGLHG